VTNEKNTEHKSYHAILSHLKIMVFWDIMPCSLVNCQRCLERHRAWQNGTYLICRKGGLELQLRVYQRGISEFEAVTFEDKEINVE